jgi:hypothetical protein
MNRQLLKRMLIVAVAIIGAGIGLASYGVLIKVINLLAIGGTVTLAGIQAAMNIHVALIRSNFDN